jgi:hypothetical protein
MNAGTGNGGEKGTRGGGEKYIWKTYVLLAFSPSPS